MALYACLSKPLPDVIMHDGYGYRDYSNMEPFYTHIEAKNRVDARWQFIKQYDLELSDIKSIREIMICPECNGESNGVNNHICHTCGGSMYIYAHQTKRDREEILERIKFYEEDLNGL